MWLAKLRVGHVQLTLNEAVPCGACMQYEQTLCMAC